MGFIYVPASGGGPGSDTDAIHDNVAGEIVAITEKLHGSVSDELVIEDSDAADVKKSLKLQNIPSGWLNGSVADTIAADQNDYEPTNGSTSSIWTITPSGADRTITGLFAGQHDGQVVILINPSTSGNDLLLTNEDAGSAATGRFNLPVSLSGTLTLTPGEMLMLVYSSGASRWKPEGRWAAASVLTTNGDILIYNGGDTRLPIGTNGQYLTIQSGLPAWATFLWDTNGSNIVDASDNIVTIDDSLDVTGNFCLTGILTPPALASDVDDYDPTVQSESPILRLEASGADRTVNGLVPPGLVGGNDDGCFKVIKNIGASNNIIIADEAGTSAAANRFALPADITIGPGEAMSFMYDDLLSRWTPLGISVDAASESDPGTIALATQSETDTETNDTKAVTPLKNAVHSRFRTYATPASFAAQQDDYDPGDAHVYRLEATGGTQDVTGFAPTGGSTSNGRGRRITVWNIGSEDIRLMHQNAGSAAANRILVSGGSDITLAPNERADLDYDPTTTRWRVHA